MLCMSSARPYNSHTQIYEQMLCTRYRIMISGAGGSRQIPVLTELTKSGERHTERLLSAGGKCSREQAGGGVEMGTRNRVPGFESRLHYLLACGQVI